MFNYRAFATQKLSGLGPEYLPFADVASDDVPLSRLLRLSLFQITVGMALVLLVGILNRVMIVELSVPATLVAGMLALPLLFAPFRTLIGFKSDVHVSALGLRRVPYIWKGTLYQFGGFAIMPFALLVLSGYGEAKDAPIWLGYGSAALSFLLVGAGVHIVQTVGLALATDLVEQEDQPKVVGLMYVMLLLGMVFSALVFGTLLENYTPGRLIQVIQGAAVITVTLNMVAMWQQEARSRDRARAMKAARPMQFSEAWTSLVQRPGMLRLLIVIGLGTFGYGMADVLLEPYGGQVLGLSVASTTKLTALFALGTLVGFGLASKVLGQGASPVRYAIIGAAIGMPGFLAIILSSLSIGIALFLIGTLAIGVGTGLFGHATLTATIRAAPANQIGLALGAWGAVQATAAGIGVALAGIVRDIIVGLGHLTGNAPQTPYNFVFSVEIVFLALALLATLPFLTGRNKTPDPSVAETPRMNAPEPHSNPMEVS
ncbi:PucC family protein [uncultured Tateyamaria sp.]|uniref:PucC family protein n=1 Tax=uncultured Tateyamaria sp. TaxID=455651 RepID=UPI0026215B9F|nr:PucC family protein [uncultured Tateyamaria sp.]